MTNDVFLLPTQETSDTFLAEGNESQGSLNVWGRLLSLSEPFKSIKLTEFSYTFGRNPDHGVNCFPQLPDEAFYLEHSKNHCQIKRVKREHSDEYETVLFDLSSNGTFINSKVIGKPSSRLLHGGDEISFARPSPKRYLYLESSEQQHFSESILERYYISRVLGRGACGEVFLAIDKNTDKRIAIKRIQLSKVTRSNYLDAKKEAELMEQVTHPGIIKIFGVEECDNYMFIKMEIAEGGELFDRIVNKGAMSEAQGKEISYQMLLALKYLHDKNIVHRDLKPENILLNSNSPENFVTKMTDFGLSKLLGDASCQISLKTFCGTLCYMAPEVLKSRGIEKYTSKIDIWSLGCIIHIILLGYQPFGRGEEEGAVEKEIFAGFRPSNTELWFKLNVQAKDLIKKMLTVDVKKRPSVDECLNHPWFLGDKIMKSRVQTLLVIEAESLEVPFPDCYIDGVKNKKRPNTKENSPEGVCEPPDKKTMNSPGDDN